VTATREDPDSDLIEGRAFLRVDVGSADEAEEIAHRVVKASFPDATRRGSVSASCSITITVFRAHGEFLDAVERICQALDEW
jgi:hypothetical protein